MATNVAQLRPDLDPLASLDPVLLQTLTARSHEVVSIVDRTGTVLFSGGAIERVFGYEPGERLGRPALDVVHPDDLDYAQMRLRELLRPEGPANADPVAVRLRNKAGEYRHCEITGTQLQQAGRPALIVLHTRDVTAQARALERTAVAEVRLDLAVRGADIGLWEYDLDSERLTRTEEWFERHQLPRLTAAEPTDEWYERIHPDDQRRVRDTVAARRAGLRVRPRLDYRIRNLAGEWTWFCEQASVIARHPDGTPRVLAGVCMSLDETKALEAEIAIAHERLQLAVDASGMALWDWRVRERRLTCSHSWWTLMRETPRSADFWQEAPSEGLERVHPDDLPAVHAAFAAHATGQADAFDYEVRRLCADGSWRWMRTHGRAIERASDGAPLRIVGCTTDVHERHLAEERLAESELRFRTASSLASEHISEFAVEADGTLRLLWCSESLPGLLRCDRERFAAECGSGRFMHPEDLPAFVAVKRDVLAGHAREVEARLVALDGRTLRVRMAVQPTSFGPGGRVTRVLSTLLELDPRGVSEADSGVAQMQRAVLEHIPACVVLLDVDGRIRFTNPVLKRHFPEAFVGGVLEELFHPHWRPVVAAAIARCRDQGRNVEVEGLARAAPGHARHSYRLHAAPVATRAGFGGWCVVLRDVTARRDAEADAFSAIGRDPQRIGHELHDGVGQQLTGVVLMMQTLATELTAERHRLAADAERVSGLVNQSIDDVRMLARSLSPVGTAPTGLAAAMHSLAARARALGNLAVDLHLAVEPGHALTALEGDHLYWIAQEAVSNAIRHAGATRLSISLEVAGEGFALRLCDNGRGIESSAAVDAAGEGLRLLAHRARGLGANFTVTSPPGGGTRVTCVRVARA